MTFVIRSEGATSELVLTDRTICIGTSAKAEVRLDGVGIEPVHVRVNATYIEAVADCDVSGIPLERGARRTVVPCKIRIGKTVVEVEFAERSVELTTRELAMCAVENSTILWPHVVVVEGTSWGKRLILREERAYRIGRARTGDLVVDDLEASREHLEVLRRGFDIFIRDLGSMGGTWLGRQQLEVQRKADWPTQRMVRMGSTILALVIPPNVEPPATSELFLSDPLLPSEDHCSIKPSPPSEPPEAEAIATELSPVSMALEAKLSSAEAAPASRETYALADSYGFPRALEVALIGGLVALTVATLVGLIYVLFSG